MTAARLVFVTRVWGIRNLVLAAGLLAPAALAGVLAATELRRAAD